MGTWRNLCQGVPRRGWRRPIESSIRIPSLVIAAAVGVIIVGVTQLPGTPVDTLPEFKPTVVEVQTEALGLSAEDETEARR